jgi:hypothetical protein
VGGDGIAIEEGVLRRCKWQWGLGVIGRSVVWGTKLQVRRSFRVLQGTVGFRV